MFMGEGFPVKGYKKAGEAATNLPYLSVMNYIQNGIIEVAQKPTICVQGKTEYEKEWERLYLA